MAGRKTGQVWLCSRWLDREGPPRPRRPRQSRAATPRATHPARPPTRCRSIEPTAAAPHPRQAGESLRHPEARCPSTIPKVRPVEHRTHRARSAATLPELALPTSGGPSAIRSDRPCTRPALISQRTPPRRIERRSSPTPFAAWHPDAPRFRRSTPPGPAALEKVSRAEIRSSQPIRRAHRPGVGQLAGTPTRAASKRCPDGSGSADANPARPHWPAKACLQRPPIGRPAPRCSC
jgi:hypothetical protein